MFAVYDNCKPASVMGFPQLNGKGWDNHTFATLKEAQEYVSEWLGDYDTTGGNLPADMPYDYNGYGDTIEIRDCGIKNETPNSD